MTSATTAKTGISLAAVITMMAVVVAGASMASADVDNDQGMVSYYTYTVDFAFKGTDAQTIEWDFGFENADGTRAASNEWNPRGIEFPGKGIYTVTQTVSNTVGSYTSQLKVQILGTPEVTFDSNGGSHVAMQTVKLGQKASVPDDPVKEGCAFAGWYSDSTLRERYDFNRGVEGHMTLYAKWTDGSSSVVDDGSSGDDGKDGGDEDDGEDPEGLLGLLKDPKVLGVLAALGIGVMILRRR